MKILIRQFLGKNHSWSVCGWGYASSLISKGHDVHLFPTDGLENLPKHLKPNVIGYTKENSLDVIGKTPDKDYDCQISYTALRNFPHYLNNGSKNRFGIWCYEWAGQNVLPTGQAKYHENCDLILAPTIFAKQIFLDSKIPNSKIRVIPHGINSEQYKQNSKIDLKIKGKFKILANIAQNHIRKNIDGMLDAYGKAFTKNDDVCLILKAKRKAIQNKFEVDLDLCLSNFKKKYPNHAELKVLSEFIDDISSLYRSIDAVFTMTHCEGFYFPGLEALAAGKLPIAPNWGGQLDFLNNDNSLLINGKEARANPNSMYWNSNHNAIWFEPNIDDAVEKLRYAYSNYEELNNKLEKNKTFIHENYDWNNITEQILNLCK